MSGWERIGCGREQEKEKQGEKRNILPRTVPTMIQSPMTLLRAILKHGTREIQNRDLIPSNTHTNL